MSDTCPAANTGEHWWLRLLGGGRRCYLCGVFDPPRQEGNPSPGPAVDPGSQQQTSKGEHQEGERMSAEMWSAGMFQQVRERVESVMKREETDMGSTCELITSQILPVDDNLEVTIVVYRLACERQEQIRVAVYDSTHAMFSGIARVRRIDRQEEG